jgi:hypothetical protein
MRIQNQKIIDFFLKYSIDYEQILLKLIDTIEPIIESIPGINYNLLVDSFQNTIESTIDKCNVNHNNTLSNINSNLNEYISFIKVSSNKGKIKENNYFNLLTNTFPTLEIENCSQVSNSMDILIKYNNLDIRLDIKDYNSNIPLKEILKFHNDMITTQSHGILISDTTGISSKESFTFDIINNKYIAFYLTHNNLDINNIKNSMMFINTISNYLPDKKDDSLVYNVSIIEKIRNMINGYQIHLKELKQNLLNSVNLCNKMTFDNLNNLLNITDESVNNIIENYQCEKCNANFDTKRKLMFHSKKCQI